MPLPFALPLIPALKLLALGTLKTVFLIIGACFFPRWTLKLLIGGASSMILPVAQNMCDSGCMDESAVTALGKQLYAIQHHEFSRVESRSILMGLVRKTLRGMVDTLRAIPANLQQLWASRGELWSSLMRSARNMTRRQSRRNSNDKNA